jgi:hypothetical protein
MSGELQQKIAADVASGLPDPETAAVREVHGMTIARVQGKVIAGGLMLGDTAYGARVFEAPGGAALKGSGMSVLRSRSACCDAHQRNS